MKNFILIKFPLICTICLIICMIGGFTSTGGSSVSTDSQSTGTVVSSDSDGDDSTAVTASGDSVDNSPNYTNVSIYINGIMVTDGLKVNGTTYIPLRTFFGAIGEEADIAWSDKTNTATVTAAGLLMTAKAGDTYFTANGRCFYVPDGVLNTNGTVSAPIRELAKVYQLDVGWDDESSSVSIRVDNPKVISSAATVYKQQDIYWLSRLISAEAGNQSMKGKIAVGDVVINRLSDPSCPSTIYGVIFDTMFGTQFSVTKNGAIFEAPNDESIVAAKLCLEGYDIVGKSIYFVNPTECSTVWFNKTRFFVATIGAHEFYA